MESSALFVFCGVSAAYPAYPGSKNAPAERPFSLIPSAVMEVPIPLVPRTAYFSVQVIPFFPSGRMAAMA